MDGISGSTSDYILEEAMTRERWLVIMLTAAFFWYSTARKEGLGYAIRPNTEYGLIFNFLVLSIHFLHISYHLPDSKSSLHRSKR